ncbi:MAG: HAD-IA family hydrolase [Candidatus Doudnabacteria bacterium]|nr:HAD-IA family hydrolase [Candidatus Doudnabacteria bacterium]
MNTTKKHFVFDLDDTLTDSYQFNQQTFVDVFAAYLDLSDPLVEKYLRDLHYNSRGTPIYDQFVEAVKHFALSIDPKVLLKADEALQLQGVQGMKIFDAVEEMIKMLKLKGKEVTIFSNRHGKSLRMILKAHKLLPYLSNVISCADEGHEKPDPYCLNKLIADSGMAKEEFIYFGDSRTDFECAQAAGIDAVIIDHYLNQKKFYQMMIQAFV